MLIKLFSSKYFGDYYFPSTISEVVLNELWDDITKYFGICFI